MSAADSERWLSWSSGNYPDDSPGDVIAWEPDGTITLDDGITTWNPLRALAAAHALLNTPETRDFLAGVRFEAAHQRQRWAAEHDANKESEEWFWVVGYLAGKALNAQRTGDSEKFLHHLVSTAAVLANWHYYAERRDEVPSTAPKSGSESAGSGVGSDGGL